MFARRAILFEIFRRRQLGPIEFHERRGHIARAALLQQRIGHGEIVLRTWLQQNRILQQPFMIQLADLVG